MEMYEKNDVIVPTFNGELRTDKPPLHYFFMMIAYHLFGINPFSARMFSVLSGIVLVLAVYSFTKKILNQQAAFYAALVMISSLQLVIQFHLAVPDPYLILLMTLGLLCFYRGYQYQEKKYIMGFFAASAFAFLTKGLIAVVLPGLCIFSFLILTKQFKNNWFTRLHFFQGALLFLIICLPWYIIVGYKTEGEWLYGFFVQHNIERYTSTMEGHRGFLLSPFVIVWIALLPFSIFIIQAIQFTWKNRLGNPFSFFCLIVTIVIPLFFSFSKTILPSYPAPAIPFLAIVLATYLGHLHQTYKSASLKRMFVPFTIYTIICLAIPIAIYFLLGVDLIFQHLKWLSIYFFILPAGALIAFYFYRKNKIPQMTFVLSASWVFTSLVFFYCCYPELDKLNPVSTSVERLGLKGKSLAYYGAFNPAFVFSLQRTIPQLSSPDELSEFFAENQNGYVITYKKYYDEIKHIPGLEIKFDHQDLFEKPITVVIHKN